MTEYKTFVEEAAKRFHKKIGQVCIQYIINKILFICITDNKYMNIGTRTFLL